MFGPSAADAKGLAMTVTGKLTVNGELKLISGANGSSLTVAKDSAIVIGESGTLEIGKKASVAGNNSITGTSENSKIVIKGGHDDPTIGTITGLNVVRPNTGESEYTWQDGAWKTGTP